MSSACSAVLGKCAPHRAYSYCLVQGLRVELAINVHEGCDDVESRVYNGQMLNQLLCAFQGAKGRKRRLFCIHTCTPSFFTHECPMRSRLSAHQLLLEHTISSCLHAQLIRASLPNRFLHENPISSRLHAQLIFA